jgi:RNA polymerase sigma-70 factor (ECF subfamily)
MSTSSARRVDATPLEASVLEGARAGDHDAFVAVIRRYDPGLRRLAYRLLGERERMDDALQEAYLRAFRALPGFRADSTLRTWLYRIVYNVCLEELERARRVRSVPIEGGLELAAPQADLAETISLRAGLATALAELPADDRAALLLVDAQGLDYREAGEVLGVPEGTIASRLHRARSVLRRALSGRVEGESER